MKICSLLVRGCLLAALALAWAQWACAQVAPSSYGGNQTIAVGGEISGFRLDYGKRDLGGIGIFADADLNNRIGLTGEANWMRLHQFADTHFSTYMGGPRLNFNTRGNWRPYLKVVAGGGLFNFPYNYATGSYFVVAGGGGLDYHIAPRWRVRVADFEYQYWPQFTFGAIHPYGVSAGLEFQLFGCSRCEPRGLGR
ncbi:outer membrane beta-barrel protein [Silvibacterium sp.]|uniref:outer membrane beta-barrel protein n=1 Tax=Silvibacterium sp. TaxID=1964179 RepID=UPI0039E7203A